VKPSSTHMITGLKQVLWRNRHLIVMAPESDAVHVVVFEETLRGTLRRESLRFLIDGDADESNYIGGLFEWEQFVGRHRDDSWIILLPHQVTISQWMDLDASESDQLEERLEEQAQQLVGLGESKIVIDYIEIPSFNPERSSYWITYCQESEIKKIISQYRLNNVAICDVLAGVDALSAGLSSIPGNEGEWMMLDVRDGGTSTIVFNGKHPRYCSFFPIGNEMAQEKGIRSPGPIRVGIRNEGRDWELQRIKKGIPLVATDWARDIQRAWQDYRISILKDNHTVALRTPVMLLAHPPVLEAWETTLKDSLEVSLLDHSSLWPDLVSKIEPDEHRHWGAVLAAQQKLVIVPSLLPESVKSAWNEKQVGMIWRSMAVLSCVFAMVVMLMAVIQKTMLWKMKNALIEEVQSGEHRFDQSLLVMQGLKREYRMLQPLIQAEQNTLTTLRILDAMQQIRTNQNGWMVLLADKDSYYAGDGHMLTNITTATNLISNPLTNRVNLRRGFILELVLNSEGEAMREELAELVAFLRERDFLYNADILPAYTRRALVNSNLVVQGKHFAVSLEMETSESAPSVNPPDRSVIEAKDNKSVWRSLQPNIPGSSASKEETP
jgi:hypothetical protein